MILITPSVELNSGDWGASITGNRAAEDNRPSTDIRTPEPGGFHIPVGSDDEAISVASNDSDHPTQIQLSLTIALEDCTDTDITFRNLDLYYEEYDQISLGRLLRSLNSSAGQFTITFDNCELYPGDMKAIRDLQKSGKLGDVHFHHIDFTDLDLKDITYRADGCHIPEPARCCASLRDLWCGSGAATDPERENLLVEGDEESKGVDASGSSAAAWQEGTYKIEKLPDGSQYCDM